MFGQLQNFWPLTLFKTDDLKCSKRLIQRLSVPEQTKQFIFAIPDRQTGSILYAVTVLSLSEQSVSDVEHVIKEVQPNAVIAQIAPCGLLEVQAENDVLDSQKSSVLPTSAFGVLRRCFKEKINKKQYENLAGSLVVKEIFGTGFFGHLRASRRAAETIDAQFLLLESPRLNSCTRSSNTTRFVGGVLASVLGIGGGFLLVPAMIYILGMPTLLVAGTSLFQIIFTTASATIMHAVFNNTVDMVLAVILIFGGVIGAQMGISVARYVKPAQARLIMAIMVLLVAFQLSFNLFIEPRELFSTAVL